MKITSARKWARTHIRHGYYRMSDSNFKIQCPVLGCREMVKVSDWVARTEEQSEYTVQQTAAHFARRVQRVSDRIRSTDYQRSVSDLVALDVVEGFLDRIARDDTASKIENRLIDALTDHLKEDH